MCNPYIKPYEGLDLFIESIFVFFSLRSQSVTQYVLVRKLTVFSIRTVLRFDVRMLMRDYFDKGIL